MSVQSFESSQLEDEPRPLGNAWREAFVESEMMERIVGVECTHHGKEPEMSEKQSWHPDLPGFEHPLAEEVEPDAVERLRDIVEKNRRWLRETPDIPSGEVMSALAEIEGALVDAEIELGDESPWSKQDLERMLEREGV